MVLGFQWVCRGLWSFAGLVGGVLGIRLCHSGLEVRFGFRVIS